MSPTAVSVDWLRLLGELSLSRTTAQFVASVEKAAAELGSLSPRLFLYHLTGNVLTEPEGASLAVDESTLAGRAALYCETVAEGERVAVPVTHFGSLIGVLCSEGGDAGLLSVLGPLVGVVYDAVRAREEDRSVLNTLQELLVQATDKAAPEGAGHVDRVAQLASKLATLTDLSEQSQQELWDAAYYHDIGTLVLEGRPYEVVRAEHAQAGARLLESTGRFSHLAPLVAAHHLRWSETADPERVPLEAWVLALAEDLDEFVSDRRYLSFEESTREFYRQRASFHHPDVVDALSGLIDSGSLASLYP